MCVCVRVCLFIYLHLFPHCIYNYIETIYDVWVDLSCMMRSWWKRSMRQAVACLLEESEELTNDITSRTTKVINLLG